MAPKPDFTPHRRIEHDYYRSIRDLLLRNLSDKTPEAVLEAFAKLADTPSVLTDIAERMAFRMVTQVRVSNARSWREAAAKASRGREIYEGLRREMVGTIGLRVHDLIAENAKMIQSIPGKVREMAANEIADMQQEGRRPEEIARYLRARIPQLTRHRAALIARTETGKAATALTRARSENLGIRWYEWQTSRDSRVRLSHRKLQGVLVNWDDPPSPEALAGEKSVGNYNAGNIWNCRCDSFPLISLDQVSWPARMYASGKIRRVTRHQFAELVGNQRAA